MSSKFAALGVAPETPVRMTIISPITLLPLCDATGQESWIDLYSISSPRAKGHERALRARRIQQAQPGRRRRETPEQQDAEAAELLAALTADWYLVGLDGKPLDIPFKPIEARALYMEDSAEWLVRQIDAFVGDLGNFTRASSTTSEPTPSTSSS